MLAYECFTDKKTIGETTRYNGPYNYLTTLVELALTERNKNPKGTLCVCKRTFSVEIRLLKDNLSARGGQHPCELLARGAPEALQITESIVTEIISCHN